MKTLDFFLFLIILLFFGNTEAENSPKRTKVLNFGTFHMGNTTDAKTTEFDEHNKERQKEVHGIAKKLADFNPTVIIVETIPEDNQYLQAGYNRYRFNPDTVFKTPSEVELLAFELGRLCQTERIYGIDHKMTYNYNIGYEIENCIDSVIYFEHQSNYNQFYNEIDLNKKGNNLFEELKLTNHDSYLDFLITINADILTHAGSKEGFEGADEAAKYYQRNLRMYSNLNRIKVTAKDRIFILMGASHTAFFRDFMSRSPKYEMVDTFDFLK